MSSTTTPPYIISPVTTWDEDWATWQTKVAIDAHNMPLHFIACGRTEAESRYRAERLVKILTEHRSEGE